MKTLFAAFAASLLAGAAFAAPPTAARHDNNAPISIASDSFQADLNAKTGTYSGNVMVTQGDIKLRANQVRISTVNGKADKVTANGNVVVDSPASGTATGETGVYAVGPRTVVMTGHVTLKKGKNVMTGAQLTVNLVTGLATVGGGAKTPGASGGRVQGVFMPNSN